MHAFLIPIHLISHLTSKLQLWYTWKNVTESEIPCFLTTATLLLETRAQAESDPFRGPPIKAVRKGFGMHLTGLNRT